MYRAQSTRVPLQIFGGQCKIFNCYHWCLSPEINLTISVPTQFLSHRTPMFEEYCTSILKISLIFRYFTEPISLN